MATPIDWNDRDDEWTRQTGSTHSFRLQRWPAWVLELSDLHFHTDSCVVLPDAPLAEIEANATPLAARVTAFSVFSECLLQARDHPTRSLLVAGHADTVGAASHNVTLSAKRAQSVLQLLKNERDAWRNAANTGHVAEDKRLILTWIATTWGWDCDPRHHSMYQAVIRLQRTYNADFGASIGEDGDWRAETWGAVFDIYQRELAEVMDLDAAGLDALRGHLQFVDPSKSAVGCGEHFPIEERRRNNYASATNRRVELTFFETPQKPELLCHPSATACTPTSCRYYHYFLYEPRHLGVSATTPRLARLPVHLRLTWRDPMGNAHPLPKDFPVELVYDDGGSVRATVDEDGAVDFSADRRKTSFTLRFPGGEGSVRYVASLDAALATAERPAEVWALESELLDRRDEGYQFWRWPDEALDVSTSDWAVTHGAWDADAKHFTGLAAATRIGARDARVPVALDPHWQYVKLLYHDRVIRRTLSVPALVLIGHAVASSSSGAPTTASNWTTRPEACQALPWVKRTPPKPDGDILLEFKTRAFTFVEGTAGPGNQQRLVTTGDAPREPLVSYGEDIELTPWRPSPERLRYYDLPGNWKSRLWHVKLSGGTGAAPAREGRWEALAGEATTDARPLMFSLDDMVLTDDTHTPEAWVPSRRCAIFSNTFTAGTNLGPTGIYKPDTGNNLSFFTQLPSVEADRNYLADYPDWTRLVVADGMLYDVFAERVGDGADRPVGARAAVRWYPTTNPGPGSTTSVSTTAKDFVTVARFYNHINDSARGPGQVNEATSPTGLSNIIGRHDFAVLRCCGLDRGDEVVLAFRYFAVDFDMAATFTPAFNPNGVPLGLTGQAANRWRDTACSAVANRWNGNASDPYNTTIPWIAPRVSGAAPVKARVLLFMQQQPAAQAHYRVGVFTDPTDASGVRAYMNSFRGTGALDQSDNLPSTTSSVAGWFTAAHEFGHGLGLNDEYIESTTSASYRLDGIVDSISGSPFDIDTPSMMNNNVRPRARHFWHAAEQVRSVLGSSAPALEVQHGTRRYRVPAHPNAPTQSFDCLPIAVDIDGTLGGRSRFDLLLFALGDDDWSGTDLPAWVGGGAGAYDGILVVRSKIDLSLHTTTYNTMRSIASTLRTRVDAAFNKKFVASSATPLGGHTFSRCLVFFTARILGATAPTDNQNYLNAATSSNAATAAQYTTHVAGLRSGQRVHHTVTTAASGGTAWAPANARTLTLDVGASGWASTVADLYADMLGVPRASRTSPAAFASLVQRVLPGATVAAP